MSFTFDSMASTRRPQDASSSTLSFMLRKSWSCSSESACCCMEPLSCGRIVVKESMVPSLTCATWTLGEESAPWMDAGICASCSALCGTEPWVGVPTCWGVAGEANCSESNLTCASKVLNLLLAVGAGCSDSFRCGAGVSGCVHGVDCSATNDCCAVDALSCLAAPSTRCCSSSISASRAATRAVTSRSQCCNTCNSSCSKRSSASTVPVSATAGSTAKVLLAKDCRPWPGIGAVACRVCSRHCRCHSSSCCSSSRIRCSRSWSSMRSSLCRVLEPCDSGSVRSLSQLLVSSCSRASRACSSKSWIVPCTRACRSSSGTLPRWALTLMRSYALCTRR
mmetsp:Transcript_56429/g.112116  ORF Transcript_56429/g.112116 Transcript_56429/m.112116 type:complete len:337 (+) Transcript_56429:2572-3582(+)